MTKTPSQSTTIDDYIHPFPKDMQELLQKIRALIHELAPEATETISYGIPTFKLNGKYLIHFAGFKDHLSLFPTAAPLEDTLPEVASYRTGKGTLQFPLNQPIPFELIKKIVALRVKELQQ